MGTAHLAAPGGNSRTHHPLDAQLIQGDHGPDNVGDGVHGSDLVEMDLLDGTAVDRGLGPGQTLERRDRPITPSRGKVGALDDRTDVAQRPVRRVTTWVTGHRNPCGRQPVPQHPLRGQRTPGD